MTLPFGVEHLGEAVGPADQVLVVGASREPAWRTTAESSSARERSPESTAVFDLVLELEVDEEAGRRQHQGDDRGEDEGEAEADREPAQRPPSFRSR